MKWSSARPGEEIGAGAEGRSRSFEEFYEAEHARLFGTLCLSTGDRREAEDLMQEAFLRVFERWDRVRSVPDPSGYLFRTAFNLGHNRYRAAVRLARRTIGLLPRVDDCFEGVEERDLVARALRALPQRQRTAIVLTELLDLSPRDAAQLMGVKDATVRSLASQGRSEIRRTMEGNHE